VQPLSLSKRNMDQVVRKKREKERGTYLSLPSEAKSQATPTHSSKMVGGGRVSEGGHSRTPRNVARREANKRRADAEEGCKKPEKGKDNGKEGRSSGTKKARWQKGLE